MVHYIDELNKDDLKGKKVLLRLDLNAPVLNGEVIDTYRLERVIETIDFLREQEAQIIIIAHCEGKESKTLVPMWHYLNGYFRVDFCSTYFTPEAVDKLLNLKDKGVLLFENIRNNEEEVKNNEEFAKKLSGMADIYVDDAFGAMHREHASIVGVPNFLPAYGGLLLRQEIEHLSRVFNPNRPFVFILGGAKFDTKLPLIKKYLELADTVFICGALANDVYKGKGFEVGTSVLSEVDSSIKEVLGNSKITVPVDVTVVKIDGTSEFRTPDKILKDEFIIDAGPETIKQMKDIISKSKTVVWNGPVGKYKKGFTDKTEDLAKIIADATSNLGVESIIGGGDTIAAINMREMGHSFSFISTGGGAMLDYLVNETLPGIKSLDK